VDFAWGVLLGALERGRGCGAGEGAGVDGERAGVGGEAGLEPGVG